jgi:cytoskeleton protein RodZ
VASFGARLKQEREQRGITLDDISQATKIGTRMLRALEEEHFDQLPGGIFNKGFVRSYARVVGIDEEQAIAEYLAATGTVLPGKQPENDASPVAEIRAQMELRQEETGRVPWGRFAAALLIVALSFASWSFYSRHSAKVPSRSDVPTSSLTPVAGMTETATPQPKSGAVDSTPNHSTLAEQGVPTAVSRTVFPHPASATTQPLVATGRAFHVLVRARQDSWISIMVDGEVTTRHTMIAPAQRLITAQNEVVIRAGNLAALDFEFNGRKLAVQGDEGEARTLIFDPAGLRP